MRIFLYFFSEFGPIPDVCVVIKTINGVEEMVRFFFGFNFLLRI